MHGNNLKLVFMGAAALTTGFVMQARAEERRLVVQPFFEGRANHDNPPPEHLTVDDSLDALNKLAEAYTQKNPKPKLLSTIEAVVAAPETHWMSTTQWEERYELELLRPKLRDLLGNGSVPLGRRFHAARILVQLGDKSAWDWAMERIEEDLGEEANWHEKLGVFVVLDDAHQEWVDRELLWSWLRPNVETNHTARAIGEKFLPKKTAEWYRQQLASKDLDLQVAEVYLRRLASFAPTPKALQAGAYLYAEVPEDNQSWFRMHNRLSTLERFAESPEASQLACRIALPLAEGDHWASHLFHRFICTHGDEQWRSFYVSSLVIRKRRYHAFEALVRLEGENKLAFLRDYIQAWEARPKYLREQALSRLCLELAGSRDKELSKWLVKRALNGDESERDRAVRQLFLLGADDLAEPLFRKELAGKKRLDLDGFLEDLNSAGYGSGLTATQVNKRIMPATPSEDFPTALMIEPKEQVRVALQLAGLNAEVECVNEVAVQFEQLKSMSRKQFLATQVVVDERAKVVRFEFQDQVVRYSVKYPEEYQDPFALAAIANALLRNAESEARFVPYSNYEGMSEVQFYFGNQELAKVLQSEYDVEFVPGWEAQF